MFIVKDTYRMEMSHQMAVSSPIYFLTFPSTGGRQLQNPGKGRWQVRFKSDQGGDEDWSAAKLSSQPKSN